MTSVYRHSLAVAYFSCYLAEKLHLKVRTKEMIRGALLHDYFLYDWHENRMITVCMVSLIRPGH
ncbi:MAG: HD domain-containing protein [Blautia sp.]